MKRHRLPRLFLTGIVIVILVTAAAWPKRSAYAATPPTIAFDFDTGSPALAEGQNTPLNQTSNGVIAYFSSPSDPAAFSVQSYGTTFYTLSQFSGKYLYDNKPSRDALDVKFDAPVTNISLTFATIELHGGAGTEPSNITLTAYVDSTASTPVGSAKARGTWPSGDSYPQGTLTFDSGSQPFNLVRIEVLYQGATAAVDFLVDSIVVVATGTPIPEFPSPAILLVSIVATMFAVFLAKKRLSKHAGAMRL